MVKLGEMSPGQLMDAVQTYPWFAAARAELCMKTALNGGMDAVSGLFAESLVHLPDGAFMYRCLHALEKTEYKDANLASATSRTEVRMRPRVAGMDFFSREEYESERTQQDAAISSMAIVDYSAPAPENTSATCSEKVELISETLAQIYANQGYPEQAKEIYMKLSLESPEKSAYFASLIDNLK